MLMLENSLEHMKNRNCVGFCHRILQRLVAYLWWNFFSSHHHIIITNFIKSTSRLSHLSTSSLIFLIVVCMDFYFLFFLLYNHHQNQHQHHDSPQVWSSWARSAWRCRGRSTRCRCRPRWFLPGQYQMYDVIRCWCRIWCNALFDRPVRDRQLEMKYNPSSVFDNTLFFDNGDPSLDNIRWSIWCNALFNHSVHDPS